MNDLVMLLGLMMVLSAFPAICFLLICEFIEYVKKVREEK